MKISKLLMTKKTWDIKSIGAEETIQETAKALLEHKVGALLVTDAYRMVGIVSERDMVEVVANPDPKTSAAPVSDIMTRSVITCGPDDEAAYVLHLMNEHRIRHMPVVEGEEIVGVLSIRELTKAYELLQVEANTDPLTKVSNRRHFFRNLKNEMERAFRFNRPISVAMLDIDHFKRFNDNYGHNAGDKVLRVLSSMLISEFRTIDLVGRLGGEEFALVFPETDLRGALIACNRLHASIQSALIPLEDEEIRFTVSMGVAASSERTPDGPTLLKRADELLYRAKQAGRNRVVSDSQNPSPDACYR